MKNWFNKYYRTIIISTFLVPIITVAVVSISHVTKWYGISNPLIWAVYLSVGIEIAALSSLAAISANMGKKVYFPFGIVTLIQFIGNIYYTYYFIDIDSKSFISWVELVSPLIEFIGVEPTDMVGHRRFLSVFSGGMLPLISLSFLHMLVKFTEEDRIKYGKILEDSTNKDSNEKPTIIDSSDLVGEISKVRLSKDDLNRIESILLKKSQSKKSKNSNKKKVNNQPQRMNVSVPIITDEVEINNNEENKIQEEISDISNEENIVEEEISDISNEENIVEEEISDISNEENIVEEEISDIPNGEKEFLEDSQFKEIDEEIIGEEINEINDSNEIVESEKKKEYLLNQATVKYGSEKNFTNEDPLYWESENTDITDKNDVKKKEIINENNGRIRKIITRNVGNTQRRWFE